MSGGYAVASTMRPIRRRPGMNISNKLGRVSPAQPKERRTMKISLKQRFRNWLLQDNDDDQVSYSIEDCEGPNIQSQGFRLNVYSASGGTIIETTKYDRKNDDNRHSLHVVTEDKDLGEELSKIITMESLR